MVDATKQFYSQYIECLDNRRLSELHCFIADDITYNSKPLTLDDFPQMLAEDVEQIPDLYYKIEAFEAGTDWIIAKLRFDCTPKGVFKGVPVNGKKVSFHEDVTYELEDGKIKRMCSNIDTAASRRRYLQKTIKIYHCYFGMHGFAFIKTI